MAAKKKRRVATAIPFGDLSFDQINELANSLARKQYQPILADMEKRRKTRIDNYGGFSAALVKALSPYDDQLGRDWQGAADLTGGTAATLGAGQTAAGGQAGSDAASGRFAAAGDVLSGLGGLGASTTRAQDTARSMASMLAANSQLQGQLIGRDYDRKMDEVRSGIPGLASDLLQNLLNYQVQKQASDANIGLAEKQYGLDVRKQSFNEATWQKEYDLALAKNQAAIDAAAAEGLQPNASLSRVYGYVVDDYGNEILGRDGKRIVVQTTTGKNAKKDKQKAALARQEKIDDTLTEISDKLAPRFEEQFGAAPTEKVPMTRVKHEEVVVGQDALGDPIYEDRETIVYVNKDGSESKTLDESKVRWQYDEGERQRLPRPQYKALRQEVMGMLRVRLRSLRLSNAKLSELANDILYRWFTPYDVAGKAPPGASV